MKERIIDWWNGIMDRLDLDRTNLRHMLLAVGISCFVLGLALGIPLGLTNSDIAKLDGRTEIIQVQLLAAQESMNATLQQALNDQWAEITSHTETYDAAIAEMQATLSELGQYSYVWGDFDNYVLYLKPGIDGQYLVNVHLSYSPGVGNLTNYATALDYFYSGINWTQESIPVYQCSVSCNGTAWAIVDVMFNVGLFNLTHDDELIQPFSCPGLNSTWQPAYVYTEIYQLP